MTQRCPTLDVEKLTTSTGSGVTAPSVDTAVNYTSYEVQDWARLEDRLLADFCERENQVEQLRRQRVWTRSIPNSPDRKPLSY